LFANIIDLNKLKSYDLKDKDKELTDKEARKARFRLLRPLGQGHNIMVYIRGSSAYIKHFKTLAGRIILINNRTRWNSWHNMLLILLQLKSKVKKYCKTYKTKLKKDLLSYKD
jgi:hypothetical protein